MIANPNLPRLTPEAYLEWEQQQPAKHEYINGEIYAMTGGSLAHNSITLNLATALKNHQRGKDCRVYMADAKVGISEVGPYFYPDIMVTCDSRDRREKTVVYHPCLIVEVLSPGTEAFDRGDKFKFYRQIDTLTEYVLITSDKVNVECFRLNDAGFWELHPYGENEQLQITTIDFSCSVSSLYEDVDLIRNYLNKDLQAFTSYDS